MAKITVDPPPPFPGPRPVDLGDGVLVPRRIKIRYEDDPGVPFVVSIETAVRGGRLACTSLTLDAIADGPPVTTEALRDVPLAGIIRQALRGLVYVRVPGQPKKYELFAPEADVAKDGPTDEALRAAATIYRIAYALNDRPTKAVASALDLTHPTAARWVARARERGFLGPTTKGHAGEGQED